MRAYPRRTSEALMVIAAADAIEKQSFDIGRHLYVDATDISPMCFRMTHLQAALRGIIARRSRGAMNS
jgi:hypothetical protein